MYINSYIRKVFTVTEGNHRCFHVFVFTSIRYYSYIIFTTITSIKINVYTVNIFLFSYIRMRIIASVITDMACSCIKPIVGVFN
jgi:hypothetical protein